MTATNTPTSYAWTISSGPAGVGTTIGTAAALDWTPTVTGTYVLQAAASNGGGAGTPDTVTITVVAASGSDPAALSGLLYRVRPTNLALADGDAVASLPMLTGGLTLANPTSGARPTYLAAGLGGRPAVRFDGTDDALISSANMTAQAQPLTLVVVYRPNDVASGQQNILHLGGVELLQENTSELPQLYAGGQIQASTGGGAWLTSGVVVSAVASGAASAIYGNGESLAAGDAGTGGITASAFTLGNHQSSAGRNYSGDVYEVLVYDHVLSAAERATVHGYAHDTYGMTVTEPPVMPSAVVGHATATAGGTSMSVTKAAVESSRGGTVTDGDVLVAAVSGDSGAVTELTAATGTWTVRLALDPQAGAAGSKVRVFTRVAASEPASWSFGQNSNSDGVVTVVCLRGVSESAVVGAIQSTAAGAGRAIPAVDHAGVAGSIELAGATLNPGTGGNAWSEPSPWFELGDAQSNAWTTHGVAVRDSLTDPTATATFTASVADTEVGVQWALVVPPATGGGGATHILGKDTDGTQASASSGNKTAVSRFTADASGVLDVGHARLSLTGGSTTTKLFVYADSSSLPGALLAASDEVTISNTTEAVIDFPFTGANRIDIVNGTAYHLGPGWADPGTPSLNISRDATAAMRQEAASYGPNPFGTPTAQSGPIDAWVEYVEPTIDATRFFLATP